MLGATRRGLAFCLALTFACGPDPADSGDNTTGDTTSAEITTTTATPTTGDIPVCGGVVLPQQLPAGTGMTYWRPVDDVGNPVDAAQIFFVGGDALCTEDPAVPCPDDGSAALIGYYVVLQPKHRTPGIYPISSDSLSGNVWIGAMLTSGSGDTCDSTFLGVMAAADGVVEVLADDNDCIAIDVRDVTPMDLNGLKLDPNGSGHAPLCDI